MQGRTVEYQVLRQQNFQLKNQITDLKNGFDLNRDVLKILEDQIKQKNPKIHILYQVISRLTGINNQVMINNMQLLIEKNKIAGEKKKLQFTFDQINEKNKQLLSLQGQFPTPKQIQISLNQQINNLQKQIFAMNQEILHKNIQLESLTQALKKQQIAQLKKPIIPSTSSVKGELEVHDYKLELNKKYGKNQQVRYQAINYCLKRQNIELKRIIQELQYRLTILARIYEIEPQANRREENEQGQNIKNLNENQLSLLMFALRNTQLSEDQETESVKLTITKRMNFGKEQEKQNGSSKKIPRNKSSIAKFSQFKIF